MSLTWKPSSMCREAGKTGGQSIPVEIVLFLCVNLMISAAVGLLTAVVIFFAVFFQGGPENAGALVQQLRNVLPMSQVPLTILIPIAYCRWVQKRPLWTMGFGKQGWFREYALGMGAGAAMMTLTVLASLLLGGLSIRQIYPMNGSRMLLFLLVLCCFFLQGLSEEVLFRGYFLTSLARKSGNLWMAVVVSALAFALAHLFNAGLDLLSFCNLVLFGIFAGICLLRRGSIWLISGFHALWNFTQGNLWGVRISGMRFGPSLVDMEAVPELPLVNGGRFGLEGSLLCTAVLAAAIVIALMLPQRDSAE